MLIENIFAISFFLFLASLVLVSILRNFYAGWLRKFDEIIVVVFIASFFVTIITAIMWIWRALG